MTPNLPNALTVARIFAVPLLVAVFYLPAPMAHWAAMGVFVVASVTDWVDGYLARRWEVTTKLGSFLDTTADKLLVTGVLIALVAVERASPWVSLIIIGRELMVLGLRGVIAAEGTVMQPSIWGRMKTAVQFLAILLAILRPGDEIGGAYADEWVMLAAAAITVGSAIDYFSAYADTLRER
jgi:CDP-diacylglycerol--glycerol-3-phosphate 3-phosphatidyltransferase